MKEFIGIKSLSSFKPNMSFKRDALIFKRIAVPALTDILKQNRETDTNYWRYSINELEWLYENQIAFEPELVNDISPDNSHEYNFYSKLELESYPEIRRIIEQIEKVSKSKEKGKRKLSSIETPQSLHILTSDLDRKLNLVFDYRVRLITIHLREAGFFNAYPLLSTDISNNQSSNAGGTEVIQIVLNMLPIPDDSVSWEEIVDYRHDSDTESKFLALRNWMSEVARGELRPIEVEQRLEYLIDQYKQHMKLHKLKVKAGNLETIVITGAEFIENFVKFKWGKMAKGLFSVKAKRIDLMEAELSVPGREVAYIVKARERFS